METKDVKAKKKKKKTMSGVGKRQEETYNKEEYFSRMMRHAAKQPNELM